MLFVVKNMTYEILTLVPQYVDAQTYGSLLILDKSAKGAIAFAEGGVVEKEIRSCVDGGFYAQCVAMGLWDVMIASRFLGNKGFLEEFKRSKTDAIEVAVVYLIEHISAYAGGLAQFDALYKWLVCPEYQDVWEMVMEALHYASIQAQTPEKTRDIRFLAAHFYNACLDLTLARGDARACVYMRENVSLHIVRARCIGHAAQLRFLVVAETQHAHSTQCQFLDSLVAKINAWHTRLNDAGMLII